MALTKITATNIGANAAANSIGYVPANKAGDIFTGSVTVPNIGVGSTADSNTTNRTITYQNAGKNWYVGLRGDTSNAWSIADDSAHRVLVDTSGRVTMPYLPAFYQVGGGYSATKTSGTFSAALGDAPSNLLNNGTYLNTTTGRFTAPIAGMYEFTVNCCLAGSAGDVGIAIRKNGSIDLAYQLLYRNVYNGNSAHAKVVLSASDYVEGLIVWNNGSTSNIYASSFSGQLIG